MKLIIDIDEDAYKEIKKIVADGNDMFFTDKLIANGTPLDEVKAEIREQQKEYQECGWAYDDVLEILDNIGKEDNE